MPPAFALSVGAGGPRPQTCNERPAARQQPLRLRNMKDTTRENPPDSAGDKRDASRDSPLAAYTPQQRKTIIKGLSILARVAIRSYMREQAEQNQDARDVGGEDG